MILGGASGEKQCSPDYFYNLKGLAEAPCSPPGNSLLKSVQVAVSLTAVTHFEKQVGASCPTYHTSASGLSHIKFLGSRFCRGGKFSMCEKI